MRLLGWIVIMVGLVAVLPACKTSSFSKKGPRTTFNDSVRQEMLDTDLQRLQFYISSPIILSRELASEEKGVSRGHTFRISRGKRIEEVVIDASTPGVIVGIEDERFLVSFEPPVEGEDIALSFALSEDRPGGYYYLSGHSWTPDGGMVLYGEKQYSATSESADAHLMFDFELIERVREEERRLTGRRVRD